ncbi:hypothetical protein ABFV43_22125, partial [Pseudomonas fulva]|uniref:hypothetical protein n=1 Tax=Pseudomonas fulva TaxID=47880 RepID=UPI0034D61DFB
YLASLHPVDWNGYKTNGINTINNNSSLQNQVTQNILSARGLNFSPIAATQMGQNEADRFGKISTFENQLPLEAAKFEQGRLN